MELAQYYELVEKSIEGLKVDPKACRGEKPGQWNLKKGRASVWIDIWEYENTPGKAYFQVMSPILEIPPDRATELYRELLELNFTLYNMAFVVEKTWVYIKSIREVNSLDQSEVDAQIDRVGFYADDFIGKLKFKYTPEKGA